MDFISFEFLLFFAIVLASLWVAPTRHVRHAILLVASLAFYASWKPAYLAVLLAPALTDYVCAIRMEESTDAHRRKRWMIAAVASNLALLGFFKYTNFFLATFASLTGVAPRHLAIALPLGISFFTFKTLSYAIDVYRGEMPACRSLWRYTMFVAYFPDLIAGPIVRAPVFLPQMSRSLRPSAARFGIGLQAVALGVTKKLLIADQLAIFADPVFADPGAYSPLTVWSAVIAYSLQIYCDFSGYSDIAIGISKIIGIDLPENFNMPYLALSPIDFWRRWHITLSQWLRDYLYYSLPGRRGGAWTRFRNAAVTALLAGLWHGAAWTFVAWGGLHGIGLGVAHAWASHRRRTNRQPSSSLLVRVACVVATYLFVCNTWVLFRSPNFSSAMVMWRKMAGFNTGGVAWFYSPLVMVLPLVIAGHVLGVMAARRSSGKSIRISPPKLLAPLYAGTRTPFAERSSRSPQFASGIYVMLPWPGFVGGFLAASWLLVLALFSATGANPFVYFQF